MSKSNDEVKIVLEDSEGKKWISSEFYGSLLKAIANLQEREKWMMVEILELRREVRILTKPKRAKAILDLIEKQDVPRRSTFFAHRLTCDEFDWETWRELVDSGKIQKVKRGKMTMYQMGVKP